MSENLQQLVYPENGTMVDTVEKFLKFGASRLAKNGFIFVSKESLS